MLSNSDENLEIAVKISYVTQPIFFFETHNFRTSFCGHILHRIRKNYSRDMENKTRDLFISLSEVWLIVLDFKKVFIAWQHFWETSYNNFHEKTIESLVTDAGFETEREADLDVMAGPHFCFIRNAYKDAKMHTWGVELEYTIPVFKHSTVPSSDRAASVIGPCKCSKSCLSIIE
jgi:hypothetical protein